MALVDDIIDLYLEYGYERNVCTRDGLRPGVSYLLDKNRIIWHYEGTKLVAFVESWRLDYEQWGRKVCRERFHILTENLTDGPVCYVADILIHPDYRRRDVIRLLRDLFYVKNRDATYLVGLANRKKTQPIKIFKVSDIGQTRFVSRMMEALNHV